MMKKIEADLNSTYLNKDKSWGFFKLGIDFLTCIIHATSKVERNEKNPNSCYKISHPY